MLLTSGLKRLKSLIYTGELMLLRDSEQLVFYLAAQLQHVLILVPVEGHPKKTELKSIKI
jgi:hypothetical protein